jgi:hypothetical protein
MRQINITPFIPWVIPIAIGTGLFILKAFSLFKLKKMCIKSSFLREIEWDTFLNYQPPIHHFGKWQIIKPQICSKAKMGTVENHLLLRAW